MWLHNVLAPTAQKDRAVLTEPTEVSTVLAIVSVVNFCSSSIREQIWLILSLKMDVDGLLLWASSSASCSVFIK